MNILVFSWRDPKHPLAGGAEQVMHEHMKGWVEAGHKVTLFSSSINNLAEKETLDGIEIIRKGYQYLGVQMAGFFYYIKNHQKYDFLIDQFHGVPFFTPIYSRKPKLAVIQEPAHNVWFLNLLPPPINYIVGILGYIFEPIFFLFYKNTHFMTGSNSAKKDIIKFRIPKKNISVIHHGIVTYKLNYKINKEKIFTITFLGILSKDKGIEDALRCFSLLSKQGKFQFWVIGKPDVNKYGEYLKVLSLKLGINNKVKFWGFVCQQKKFELLSRSHLLINPSTHEGWGLVNIEANSVGVPVIAYNLAGLIDSVKDGVSGLIVDKNTPQCLAEKVMQVLNNSIFYKKLQKRSVKWSKQFFWKKSISQSLNLILMLSR